MHDCSATHPNQLRPVVTVFSIGKDKKAKSVLSPQVVIGHEEAWPMIISTYTIAVLTTELVALPVHLLKWMPCPWLKSTHYGNNTSANSGGSKFL